ncbi:hypothetical protein, partial [Streptomyces griseolus]
RAGALVLRHSTLGESVTVPVEPLPDGRFTAALALPPREGDWEVYADDRPVRVLGALAARLPLDAPGHAFRLVRLHGDRLVVRAASPLTDAERGAYRQGRLRTA